jgi:hypothetical protein
VAEQCKAGFFYKLIIGLNRGVLKGGLHECILHSERIKSVSS